MQNSEWLKKFSLFLILIIIFIFIYGSLNFIVMSLDRKRKELNKELDLLKEEYTELIVDYENLSNPKNLIEKAIDNLKLKFGTVEVIEVDTRDNQQ